MSRTLTPNSNIETLRKEAKRLRKAVAAGEPDAVARFGVVFPNHAGKPSLREAQQALAREHGFVSWAALKQELEDRARSHDERVLLFLEKAVNRYGVDPRARKWGDYERDGPARGVVAARLLARHPEIARENIHTAVVAHDIDAVRSFLAKDKNLADQRHPFDDWTPLQRLAYARLPLDTVVRSAIPIATALLDAGADAKASWSDGSNNFTCLTGVIGGGEGNQSAHPQAEALARLLIERGADPLDGQALYNTSLGADDTFWLDLLWAETEKRGQTARWREPVAELGAGAPLDYLLGNAVPHHPKRAAWLLAHGADARAANNYSRQPIIKHAALAGQQEIVDLLVSKGAMAPALTDEEAFLAAAAGGEAATMRRLASEHPDYLRNPHAMFAAVQRDRADVVGLLLDLGMSPDIGDMQNFRALHLAADCGAVEVAKLLIARGAEIDALETRYGGTPLSHANYHARSDMIALLAPVSRDVRGLCYAGAIERMRELLTETPDLANRETRGELPLFCLPDEEERAVELVELLLWFGADPKRRNQAGQTPAEAARKRGLEDVADLLSDSA